MKEITAVVVPKDEKKPLPKKEEPKPEVVKKEEPKEAPKTVAAPPPAVSQAAPPAVAAPEAAPPPAVGADFAFADGAHEVKTTSDPLELYRGNVEYAFRSRWQKPDEGDDTQLAVEVEVGVGPQGQVTQTDWKRGSGNAKWDATVRAALAATKAIGKPPPSGFPSKFTVRFDAVAETEPVQ
jgi:colicin import membrane protein